MKSLFPFFLLSSLALAADNVPPGPQLDPLLITGATVHLVSGDPVPDAQLLLVDGMIDTVAAADEELDLPFGTEFLDLPRQHIYPGFISANSVLGLTEINAVRATIDIAEPGAINPNTRAWISVNPDSELIPVTRANGVLHVLTIPRADNGGLIGGQSGLIRLDGWTWEDMTVKSPAGMHVYWPELRDYPRWNSEPDEEKLKKLREAYDEKVEMLTNAFADARAYLKAKNEGGARIDSDLRWEAMKPVLEGELRLFIHANTAAQIRNALHFCRTEGIASPVIVGGRDAWRVTDELIEQDAAVIISAVNELPLRRWEAYDTPYVAAQKLHEAGVRFCIANSGSAFDAANERNLPYEAARAVAHGLPHDIALKSITLYPAEILGVGGRLGSLEPGKEATFIITDGDPLEVMTNVERAFVRGREIDLTSKHTDLYEKYQEKYRQLQ